MGKESNESAPELVNREQADEGQAQDVAEDALHPLPPLPESRHGPGDPGQLLPDDVPDLVDRMNEMIRSGRIDNDAYIGEPSHDDEEEILGPAHHEEAGDPIEEVIDEGNDPLGEMSSDYGLEDGSDPDAGPSGG